MKLLAAVFDWASLNLIYPLLPIIVGVILAFLSASNIDIETLFGGTELLFLSFIIMISIQDKLYNEIKRGLSGSIYSILHRVFQIFGIITILIFAFVYVHTTGNDIGLMRDKIAQISIIVFLSTAVISTTLQIFIIKLNDNLETGSRHVS